MAENHIMEEQQQQSQSLSPSSSQQHPSYLPNEYVLHEDDVICGRGSKCFNHIGNCRFRDIILDHLVEYKNATTKNEKNWIIRRVIDQIRSTSRCSHGVGFVKMDNQTKCYYEVGDLLAVRTRPDKACI
jgi:hypothetical protein